MMITRDRFTPFLTALALGALAIPVLAAPHAAYLKFMKAAAQGGMTEVALGHLAAQHGANRGVRQFGMQMVRDHSQANHELRQIAAQDRVALPGGLGPKGNRLRARLSRLQGSAFDRAYVRAMIADHQEDIADFRRESRGGSNPPVRTFAGKYLPVIQGHLMMVQDLHHKGL